MTTEALQQPTQSRTSGHSVSQMFQDLRYISESETTGTSTLQRASTMPYTSGGYSYEIQQPEQQQGFAQTEYYYPYGVSSVSLGQQQQLFQQPSVQTSTTFESSSRIADSVLSSNAPIDVKNATEMVTVKGETGYLLNKEDIVNWRGPIPISEYPINEDINPEILRKKTEQHLVYLQEVAIRYLRPPTPPPPGDIIIREEQSTVPPLAPPLVIRQQAPRPETPAPLVYREAPPKPPHSIGQKVITVSGKRLPPPPRKVIIERLPPLPVKPQSVIVERWLPYKERKRRVIFQKASQPEVIVPQQKNVIIQWEAPSVEIRKEFKDLGILRANPVEYVQRFGPSLKQAFELPDFVKQIRPPSGVVLAAEWLPTMLDLEGDVQALSLIDLEREGLAEYRNIYKRMEPTSLSTTTDVSAGWQQQLPTTTTFVSGGNGGGVSSWQQVPSSTTLGGGNGTGSLRVQKSNNGHLREIFAMMDVDADGIIRINEARRALLLINERLGRNYGEQDAQMLINSLDKRRDGRIDYNEFKETCMQNYLQ